MGEAEIGYLKKYWEELEQIREQLLCQTFPELTQEDFELFHKTGNRLVYENAYFGRRKYLTVFGILAEFGGRQEDIERLAEVLTAVCEERFWALPAHVNFHCPDENTIDLFAAETAQTLAELLVIFKNKLPEELVKRVKEEIRRRVLIPFCTSDFPYSGWETDRCNWSAVCAGSVGMAAIYMYRLDALSKEWKENCITRVCNALQCYLSGLEEDGACTEGLGYYNYGMTYFTAFAELLYEETDGKINLMTQPKCEQIAAFQGKCYFGKGISVSFSDGSSEEHFLPGMTAYLAHCFPGIRTPDYSVAHFLEDDACYRWLMNERNIRWLMKYGQAERSDLKLQETERLSAAFLPSAQWMICKDSDGNGYAAKGGHNAESHNHNDIGHFLCVYDGHMLLTDLGAGEYTKEYFGAGRYEILCNRSLGHSVPLINDCEQGSGSEYRAEAFEWQEGKKELRISFAGAYPKEYVEKLERRIWMNPDLKAENTSEEDGSGNSEIGLHMTVTDWFVPSAKTQKITENLITPYEPKVLKDGRIWIGAKTLTKAMCYVDISHRMGTTDWQRAEEIRIIPMEHSLHDGEKTTVYLLQWDVPICRANTSECRMTIYVKSEK